MITISDISQCCGCTACVTVCPRQAVVLRRDREGFEYPVANQDMCIACGKCDDVCPMPELRSADTMNHVSPQDRDLACSVRDFIAAGGVVFGPVLERDGHVGYSEIDDEGSVSEILFDNPVQSDLYASFEDVAGCLDNGRKVMFIGVPCVLAGLQSYLGEDHDTLSVLSIRCTGVSSPGLWDKYAGSYPVSPAEDNPYRRLHDMNLILRPSCLSCRFNERRGISADIEKRQSLFNGYNSKTDILEVMNAHVVCPSLFGRLGSWISSVSGKLGL